jgi:iron complex outermembrane receptor protein
VIGVLAMLLLQDPAATLRIQVVEPRDRPVEGASITIGTRSARTGPDGRAVVVVPAGRVEVVVGQLGYRTDSLVLLLRPAQDTAVRVRLAPEAESLEALVVTATRIPRRVEDQPLRVEVLGTEEIEEKLLMTPGDITMLLNETGGLRVQTTSPSLGGANVRVQGLRGRYTLLLSDGLPLYGGQTGGLGLLQVPPMDLAQVEIIKGAASALFGPSALGGVVNLVSRQPVSESQLLFNGTSLGGSDAVVFAAKEWSPRWGSTLLAGYHRQGRSDRDDDGWTDVPGYDRVVVRPRVFHSFGRDGSLFLTAGATREGRDGGTIDGATAPDGSSFDEHLTTTRLDAGAVLMAPLSEGLSLQARMSGMTQRHRHRFGAVRESDRHSTVFAEVAISGGGRSRRWLAGIAGEGDRYRSTELPTFDYDHSAVGGFAQVEQELGPASLAGSARVDHHNRYGTFLSPRLSMLIRAGGAWRFRGSVGGGFFGPTPFTEETEVTGLSRVIPPFGLGAERAWTASADASVTLGVIEAGAVVFASRVRDAVQRRQSPDNPARVELINAESPTNTLGGELLARYRRAPFGVTASYVHTRAREDDPQSPGRREVPLTPRHTAGVVVTWESEEKGRAGLELYYTGRQALEDNPYRAVSRSYLIAGLLVEWRVGGARVFVNLENLGDVRQTHYDRLVRPAIAPDGRWTTDAWAPLDGRVVNGGVRLPL